jgi:hypothetical protein
MFTLITYGGFAAGLVALFLCIRKAEGACMGWFYGMIVWGIIMFITARLADPYYEPTPEAVETRRRNNYVEAHDEREHALQEMNKAVRENKPDKGIYWSDKALEAQKRLEKNTPQNIDN